MLNTIINLTVFFTGAAVLVIEVTATRLLSPYFGNTIFSVSSILSIVLGALAVGYLLGGKLADRSPKIYLFFLIIWFGGASVLLINILSGFFLEDWSVELGNMLGPLIASAVLFFVPSFLLGMLSPFAIRLKGEIVKAENIGSSSGEVFFFSTLGSIIGSLLTGFILIPNIGISRIIFGTGIFLMILGGAGFSSGKFFRNRLVLIIAVSLLVILAHMVFSQEKLIAGEIWRQEGSYERISVIDNAFQFEGRRTLFLDRSPSTAVFLSDGSPLATNYAEYLELSRLSGQEPERILVLGGGAYAIPRYARQLFPEAEIDVVEIEPRLPDIAEKFFNFTPDAKIKSHIADGRIFLARSEEKYDLIFVDVYSSFLSIPTHMVTKEFFDLLKQHLSEKGIVLMNVVGSLKESDNGLLRAEINTFSSVFDIYNIFALSGPHNLSPQNFVFFGTQKNADFDLIRVLSSSAGSFAEKALALQVNTGELDIKGSILLTDDYAPTEYLIAPLVALY